MIFVRDIKLGIDKTENDAVEKAIKTLGITHGEIKTAGVSRLSVDARHGKPQFVFTVAVSLKNENNEQSFLSRAANIAVKSEKTLTVSCGSEKMRLRPIICGLGPAGLFAALLLAQKGFKPIVLERGAAIPDRVEAVERFNKTGALDINSNIQFGEGGAGTFSDGKLTTRIGDELCGEVTKTLLRHGAPDTIAYLQKPHIGTDLLRNVIVNIRREIVSLGGEVLFNTPLTGLKVKNGALCGVETANGEIACNTLILAPGHSARDIFAMLFGLGAECKAKPFSVGFRIEHLQSDIDKALYHGAAGNPALPKGEYQLSTHIKDRCVYTFCMCPGGKVVAAASEEGGTVTNGMSNHARDGKNANAAVVVSVGEKDFSSCAEAIEFQKKLETAAFQAGGGEYKAPCQNTNLFLNSKEGLNITNVQPTYPRGVVPYDMGRLFPAELSETLRQGLLCFDKKIKGYASPQSVITGVETRTSSPVRIIRGANYESPSIKGLYPCGEGAGYAGGIVSAAVDGLRTASAIIEKYNPSAL